MDAERKEILHKTADAVRQLSMEAVQKANSGHPGLPMGCAEIGAYLFANCMRYNPKNPDWFNRDRLILSAGHGSMWLYSLLHLSGYNLSLEEIKNFRQLHSKTPGHPERLDTEGVEVTTGPLGQGVANAVGMALSYKMLEERFNRDDAQIIDNKIFCLAGDGCMMEGVSQEACSLAGHLKLDNLILIYDMNYITLDGEWKESCSDDQILRFKSYGWDVIEIADGNDLEQIHEVFSKIRENQDCPRVVIAHTVIGKGSPHKEGTNKAHGSPLGPDEVALTKKELGLPAEEFYVPPAVKEFFAEKVKECAETEKKWNESFGAWKAKHPDLHALFKKMKDHHIPHELKQEIASIEMGEKISGRKASQNVLQVVAKHCPYIVGGSADLSESNSTELEEFSDIQTGDFSGRNIKFGVREFAMCAAANGMSTTLLRPFVGTFFCFMDYCRNAIRLAALSKHPSIFVFTHDSVFLGEDGPTHQPIEHLAASRAIPGLHTWRPGDANEVKGCWWWALNHQNGPSVLVFTRQALPTLKETQGDFEKTVCRGGYILISEDKNQPIDYTLIATGSELHLAVEVCQRLKKVHNKNVRVVSLPCWRLFEEQDEEYRDRVLGGKIGTRVSMEAGTSFGWERYIGVHGIAISIEGFGRSAPIADLQTFFGFTPDLVIERILTHVKGKSLNC